MKKTILKLAVIGLLVTAIAAAPNRAFGDDKTNKMPATGSADAAKPKRDTAPFRGKVGSVDKAAMTFTVGERTFQVSSETKIMKGGKPATLEDAAVGDEVGGSYKKTADGKLVALSVRFGAKPEGEAKPAKPAKPAEKSSQ